MGLHGYETSRNTFKEFAWLCAFAVARGGKKAEDEVRKISNSFVGYICGKGVEEEVRGREEKGETEGNKRFAKCELRSMCASLNARFAQRSPFPPPSPSVCHTYTEGYW